MNVVYLSTDIRSNCALKYHDFLIKILKSNISDVESQNCDISKELSCRFEKKRVKYLRGAMKLQQASKDSFCVIEHKVLAPTKNKVRTTMIHNASVGDA